MAIVIVIAVALFCLFVGGALSTTGIPFIGGFLTHWGWAIGLVIGLWYFLSGKV